MKIAVAQLNFHVGNFEVATTAYPPRDFVEFDDFVDQAEETVNKLAKAAKGIAIIVGSISRNPVIEGKDLYNSAYFLEDGKVKQVQHKALLPTYDIFDEYRYFEPANEFKIIKFKGKKIALTICEDMWNLGNENPLYTICPMDELMPQKPDLMINVSASPFAYDHAQERIDVLKANVDKYKLPLFYINHSGAQTEVIFDGGSIIMSPDGKVFEELPYFEECIKTYDLAAVEKGGKISEQLKDKMQLIHDSIILGIKDYFGKLGFQRAIFGLSGGIDSAVTAVLAARALGEDNVRAVLMPSEFSSDHSINDARELAKNLGIQYDIIPIQKAYESFKELLYPHFLGTKFGIAEENIQARTRGVLLMAMSNKFGNILLNTSNKSEAAVGYGTLYGDMCGGLSVIADVYKTDVFALARYINKDGEVIPENTITKPPSAELRPDQKDSDSLPDYAILDEILYQYIEKQQGPKEIIEMGFDEKLVRRILRLVNINEFKRYQTPPILRVSSKAFGMGRRMPIVGKYLS